MSGRAVFYTTCWPNATRLPLTASIITSIRHRLVSVLCFLQGPRYAWAISFCNVHALPQTQI